MWRIRKNNLIINDKDKLFVHRVHLERLLHAKTHIKNKGPEIPYFMKNKLSKKELLRSKERKRCYENAIIFSRLLEINKSISPYSRTHRPAYCASFDLKKYNFNKTERKNDLAKSNLFLFSRLVQEKSHYLTKDILKENNYEMYLKQIIRRQRTDNPNIDFASFTQFKRNIEKNYKLKKSHSTSSLEPACLNYKNKGYKMDTISRNNTNLNFGLTSSSNRKNCQYINGYKFKNNNKFGTLSTMMTTKRDKKNLSRCQSAFLKKTNYFKNNK